MKFKSKVVAAVSATVMTAGMVMSSVPAFAGSEEMDFINSYNGEVRQWAQYVIDEGCTLEEAQELVDSFIEGEKAFREESNASSGISTCADGSGEEYDEELGYYYDTENLALSRHYVAIISTRPNDAFDNVKFTFSGRTTKIIAPAEDSYRLCFGNVNKIPEVIDSLSYPTSEKIWNYKVEIPQIKSSEKNFSNVVMIIPMNIAKGANIGNEEALNNSIECSCSSENSEGKFLFETFAMGDLNHNGRVTLADTYLLEKYLIGVDPDLEYKDKPSSYCKSVKLVASDVNQDNSIALSDVILLNKFIGGSYEM